MLTRTERLFSLVTKIRPGEGRGLLLLCINGFLLLCAYLILKTLREPLILTEFGAETKSYAVAAIAVVLFFLVPLYGILFRYTNRTQLVITVNSFFVSNLVIFYLLHLAGISISFAYFVWIGVFGVMVVAQFWAYVTDIYNVKSGQRIFPIIMIATSLGGLVGAQIASLAFDRIGLLGLMILSGLLLIASMFLYRPARLASPDDSRCIECEFATPPKGHGVFGGFALVLSDPYLRAIAVFVVLLNWINSTGEYMLSEMVVQWAGAAAATSGRSESSHIAEFYGNYAFLTSLLGLSLQTLVVARVIRYLGLPRSLMILPMVSFIGYALLAFFPVFTLIRVVKITENGLDSSLLSTVRQALFLPTSREVKYEGRTAIDTFFWRFGDLVQGGAILIGVNVFGFGVTQFALLNAGLACVFLVTSYFVARRYCRVVSVNGTSLPPQLHKPIDDVTAVANQTFTMTLDKDTFVEPDPGGVITLRARLADGEKLPRWLSFKPSTGVFTGVPPRDLSMLKIKVIASDYDELETDTSFTIRVVPEPFATV